MRVPYEAVKKAVGALATLAVAACSDASAISPPKGAQLLFEATARGANVFSCEGTRWVLKEKEEEALFDQDDRPMGRGIVSTYSMRWQANDGSVLLGQLAARQDREASNDIPSLLFTVTGHQGAGAFAPVQTVLRIRNVGGVPGSRDCTEVGAQRRAVYSALYQFYGPGEAR